jgi:hypothetical protein
MSSSPNQTSSVRTLAEVPTVTSSKRSLFGSNGSEYERQSAEKKWFLDNEIEVHAALISAGFSRRS